MSISEKFLSIMKRPGEDAVPKDEVPWWLKYSARALGTVGGGLAIFLGLWNCLGIIVADVGCLLGGMWQIVAGFVTIVIEAPCCCLFIDYVQTASEFVDKRPYWNRAALYCGIAIPALLFCLNLSSFFGSGLIFATGILYGMMSLGKKASVEEMRAAAQQQQATTAAAAQQSTSGFFSSSKSTLVDNVAPVGYSSPLPPV